LIDLDVRSALRGETICGMYGVNGLAATNAAARCKWDQQRVEVRCGSMLSKKSAPL